MAEKLKPFFNIGPGQIIRREMEALNWSQEDLADIMGMSPKSISLIINNKQSITVETALLLAKAFNTSPEFWLSLEQNYRLRLKDEGDRERETQTKAGIRKYMPILEMKKKGWLYYDATTQSQEKAFNEFWQQDQTDFSVYEKAESFCTRQKKNDENYTKYYTYTWLHKAKMEASKFKTGLYIKDALNDLFQQLPEFTLRDDGVVEFLKQLNQTGVKFFVLSHLQKTYLDGASFFDGENPAIVYTARYNRVDNFWWTITHEIAHIILHLKKETDCFLDDLDENPGNEQKEKEADELAGNVFRVQKLLEITRPYRGYISETRLSEISNYCGLSTSVALGILKHNGFVDYRTLNRYKQTVLDLIPGEFIQG